MKKRSLIVLRILMITLLLFQSLSFSTPASGSDELKRELLKVISVDKPELFDDYDELYLAKAKAQAVIQGMEGWEVTLNTKEWVNILLGIIDDFEAIADLSKSSFPSDHVEAVETAGRINTSINTLRRYDIAKEDGIPMLVELALKRFYKGEGEFFKDAARNEEETRVKIEYARNSSIAYGLGGMPTEKSRMEFESRRLDWMYKRDMERASGYISEANAHLVNAENPSSGFFGDAAAFMEIKKAKDSFDEAKDLYEEHKDKELENVRGIENEIKSVYRRLMLDTLVVVAFYLLILSFFTFIIWKDFKRWGEELDDTRLGEELIV